MIKLTTLILDKDHPEDAAEYSKYEQHECKTSMEALPVFNDSVVSVVARCDTDEEFLGLLRVVGMASNAIAKKALAEVDAGTVVDISGWISRGQLIDATGWRMIFGREPAKLKKPAEAAPAS